MGRGAVSLLGSAMRWLPVGSLRASTSCGHRPQPGHLQAAGFPNANMNMAVDAKVVFLTVHRSTNN